MSAIDELFELLRESGAVVRLYGQPIGSPEEMRLAAQVSLHERNLADLLNEAAFVWGSKVDAAVEIIVENYLEALWR